MWPSAATVHELLAFSVPRVAKIRDARLGAANLFLSLAIAAALTAQLVISKAYYKAGPVTGATRVQPLAPAFEWTAFGLGAALPYCTPETSASLPTSSSEFSLLPPTPAFPLGAYQRAGAPPAPVYACTYLDANWAVPNPLEVSAVFLPTRTVAYDEFAPACAPGANYSSGGGRALSNGTVAQCSYAAAPALDRAAASAYVPDVEAYTLLLQHSAASEVVGQAWGMADFEGGALLDPSGATIDPCAFYARQNAARPCPRNLAAAASASAYISVGVRGVPDIVAVGSLLEAAGIRSLDEPSAGAPGDTHRYAGLTLLVTVAYDNYFASPDRVRYTYSVRALPGKVKGATSTPLGGGAAFPSPARRTVERSGLRIIFTPAGVLGRPDASAGWIATASVLSSLGLAAVVMGFVVGNLLRLSSVYRRYIEVKTPMELALIGGARGVVAGVEAAFEEEGGGEGAGGAKVREALARALGRRGGGGEGKRWGGSPAVSQRLRVVGGGAQ